ncbi:hypothetical protein KGM_208265 [Danaus plexippus plexippus]|uniref:FLYWCH-type domain-containing protein n=1 Tax=Danaus plexippus plexippus TaxID=278856 RepID=A0A212EXU9_DANPL|nr:hypothetical protein KGM_208265 [Danaus plexippus plexippus]
MYQKYCKQINNVLTKEDSLMYSPIFTTSSRGATILVHEGFKFRKHRTAGAKTRWWCGDVLKGCRAFIVTVNDVILRYRPTFFTSKIGARIMKLRGYWYTRHSVCSSRVKWLCAESRHKQCHAIVVTIGCMTVDRQNKHTHPPLLNASRQTDVDFLQLLDSNNRLMSS